MGHEQENRLGFNYTLVHINRCQLGGGNQWWVWAHIVGAVYIDNYQFEEIDETQRGSWNMYIQNLMDRLGSSGFRFRSCEHRNSESRQIIN
jgi:hypothetical protein